MRAKFQLSRAQRYNTLMDIKVIDTIKAGASAMPVYLSEDSLIAGMTTDLSITQRRISKTSLNATKICLVCGDRALGYNFNAISCESCKAFFRRNAFKTINGRCNGDCEVTVESRSYCKRCRLQKCFTVGMKRDLILNDQQKQFRSRKIRENRMKKTGSGCGLSPDTCEGYDPSTTTLDLDPGEPPQPVSHIIASEIDTTSIDRLDEMSRNLIIEVMSAFQITFDRPMERQPIDTPSNVEFLNMADTSVRRLVKMAKQLKFFKGLDQEDQISLLKGAVVEVLILRSSKMFNSGSLDWKVDKEGRQHTVSAMSFTQGSPESMAFIMQYQRFVRSLLMSTRSDNVILMILIVLTLFSPDRASRESVQMIAAAQETYAAVLQNYVLLNHPDQPLMLARLIQRLADIRDMNEKHTAMLMNMQIDKLEPLITEIFDLSC